MLLLLLVVMMLLQYIVALTICGNDEGNVVGTFAFSVNGKGAITCCNNVCWNNIEKIIAYYNKHQKSYCLLHNYHACSDIEGVVAYCSNTKRTVYCKSTTTMALSETHLHLHSSS